MKHEHDNPAMDPLLEPEDLVKEYVDEYLDEDGNPVTPASPEKFNPFAGVDAEDPSLGDTKVIHEDETIVYTPVHNNRSSQASAARPAKPVNNTRSARQVNYSRPAASSIPAPSPIPASAATAAASATVSASAHAVTGTSAPEEDIYTEEDAEFDDFSNYQRYEDDDDIEDDDDTPGSYEDDRASGANVPPSHRPPEDDLYDDDDEEEPPKKRKKKRGFFGKLIHFIWVLFLILTVLITVEVVRIGMNVDYQPYTASSGSLDGVENILILGTDSRESSDRGRSDAMIILSMVPAKHRLLTVSLLRDTAVTIDGYGVTRLNSAYALGGAELAVKTVEANYGIVIDDYILVDMTSIWQLIDAAGGSICEVEPAEASYINGYLFELNNLTGAPYGTSYIDETTNGTVLLDGRQAVSYGRIRYIGTDFARTSRQREVLAGMFKNVARLLLHGNVIKLGQIYLDVPGSCSCITTSLPAWKMALLFNSVTGIYFGTAEKVSTQLPLDGTWWNDNTTEADLIGIDWDANRAWLYAELGK